MKKSGFCALLVLICALLLLIIGFTIGCSEERATGVKKATLEQLFTNPDKYNGKQVIVEGFYFHGFETIVLSERLEYSGYAEGHLVPKGKMLWVEGGIPKEIYDKLNQQQMMGPAERYGKVKITGKFEYGGQFGHLGAYGSQIVPLEVELLPWSPPVPQISQSAASSTAREALAVRLGVAASQIEVLSVEEVMWSNTSLGCPEPDRQYSDVIVPGFRIILEYEGRKYEYHTNEDGTMVVTCSNTQAQPDLIGKINSVQQVLQGDKPGLILVDSLGDKTSDKYVLTITTDTSIQRQVGQVLEPASFGDLQVGQDIKVWLTGPVRESYPAQADAQKIVIVGSSGFAMGHFVPKGRMIWVSVGIPKEVNSAI